MPMIADRVVLLKTQWMAAFLLVSKAASWREKQIAKKHVFAVFTTYFISSKNADVPVQLVQFGSLFNIGARYLVSQAKACAFQWLFDNLWRMHFEADRSFEENGEAAAIQLGRYLKKHDQTLSEIATHLVSKKMASLYPAYFLSYPLVDSLVSRLLRKLVEDGLSYYVPITNALFAPLLVNYLANQITPKIERFFQEKLTHLCAQPSEKEKNWLQTHAVLFLTEKLSLGETDAEQKKSLHLSENLVKLATLLIQYKCDVYKATHENLAYNFTMAIADYFDQEMTLILDKLSGLISRRWMQRYFSSSNIVLSTEERGALKHLLEKAIAQFFQIVSDEAFASLSHIIKSPSVIDALVTVFEKELLRNKNGTTKKIEVSMAFDAVVEVLVRLSRKNKNEADWYATTALLEKAVLDYLIGKSHSESSRMKQMVMQELVSRIFNKLGLKNASQKPAEDCHEVFNRCLDLFLDIVRRLPQASDISRADIESFFADFVSVGLLGSGVKSFVFTDDKKVKAKIVVREAINVFVQFLGLKPEGWFYRPIVEYLQNKLYKKYCLLVDNTMQTPLVTPNTSFVDEAMMVGLR